MENNYVDSFDQQTTNYTQFGSSFFQSDFQNSNYLNSTNTQEVQQISQLQSYFQNLQYQVMMSLKDIKVHLHQIGIVRDQLLPMHMHSIILDIFSTKPFCTEIKQSTFQLLAAQIESLKNFSAINDLDEVFYNVQIFQNHSSTIKIYQKAYKILSINGEKTEISKYYKEKNENRSDNSSRGIINQFKINNASKNLKKKQKDQNLNQKKSNSDQFQWKIHQTMIQSKAIQAIKWMMSKNMVPKNKNNENTEIL